MNVPNSVKNNLLNWTLFFDEFVLVFSDIINMWEVKCKWGCANHPYLQLGAKLNCEGDSSMWLSWKFTDGASGSHFMNNQRCQLEFCKNPNWSAKITRDFLKIPKVPTSPRRLLWRLCHRSHANWQLLTDIYIDLQNSLAIMRAKQMFSSA